MKCVLMHKDIDVLQFDLDGCTGDIINTGEVYNKEHVPLGIRDIIVKNFYDWWNMRAIPDNRVDILKILERLNIKSILIPIMMSNALSVTDKYWFHIKYDYTLWSSVNFWDNKFNEDIGNIMCGFMKSNNKINFRSLYFTTNRYTMNRWFYVGDKIYLSKYDGSKYINEVVVNSLVNNLGISNCC